MSVVRKTPTDMVVENKDSLIHALEELFGKEAVNVSTDDKKLSVRGERYGRRLQADIVVTLDQTRGFDVGFSANKSTGKYEVVGDWYGMSRHRDKLNKAGIERHDRYGIVSKVHEGYIKHSVGKQLRKQGFMDKSKKNDYVMRKQEDGTTKRARQVIFQRSGF